MPCEAEGVLLSWEKRAVMSERILGSKSATFLGEEMWEMTLRLRVCSARSRVLKRPWRG